MRDLWRTILDAYTAWSIAAWVLLIGGLLLLIWALFWDRPGWFGRPRERCPGCGYDMSGTAGESGIVCPECGRAAKSRRVFRRTRRRWVFVAVAVVLFAGWHVASRVQRIRVYGWWETVPTPLVWLLTNPADMFLDGHVAEWKSLTRTAERRFDTCGPVMHWMWWPSIRRELELRGYVTHDLSGLYEYRTESYTTYRETFSGEGPSVLTMHEPAWESEEAVEATWQLCVSLIDPEDWVDHGGDAASLWIIRDHAIVHAPDRTQQSLSQFLDSLVKADCWPSESDDAIRAGDRWVLGYCTDRFVETDWFEQLTQGEQASDPEAAAEDVMDWAIDLIHEDLATAFTDDFDDGLYGRWILHAGGWRRPRLLVVCLEDDLERVIEAMDRMLEIGPSQTE